MRLHYARFEGHGEICLVCRRPIYVDGVRLTIAGAVTTHVCFLTCSVIAIGELTT